MTGESMKKLIAASIVQCLLCLLRWDGKSESVGRRLLMSLAMLAEWLMAHRLRSTEYLYWSRVQFELRGRGCDGTRLLATAGDHI